MATVAGLVKDLQIAEDAVQDACIVALSKWTADGVPGNPRNWLIGVACHKALDRLRREARRPEKEATFMNEIGSTPEPPDPLSLVDDQLALIFACCHPALDPSLQVALTLRFVCGLTTADIAAAFLVPEATMAKRLVRAKHKIRDSGIALRIPQPSAAAARLASVLKTTYLVYSEGHTASRGDDLMRTDLCQSALRLAHEMVRLLPTEPEVLGLLALILLTEARRPARLDSRGELVLLPDQDRQRWDQALIAAGQRVVEQALQMHRPGPYQIWAAIAACHSGAPSAGETDWFEIVGLYDELLRYEPTDTVRANRAVAVAMIDGPAAGLAILDGLADNPAMQQWPQWHIARAELLRQLDRPHEAIRAYDRAINLGASEVETTHLRRRRQEITAS